MSCRSSLSGQANISGDGGGGRGISVASFDTTGLFGGELASPPECMEDASDEDGCGCSPNVD